MKMLILTGLAIICCQFSSGYAETFKWVDEEGRVHYSDQPQGENTEKVKIQKFKPDPVLQRREQQRRDSLQQNQEARENEKTAQKESKEEKQLNEENCKTAKDALQRYKNVGRLYREDENGERTFLSDEERALEMKKMQKAIKDWCV